MTVAVVVVLVGSLGRPRHGRRGAPSLFRDLRWQQIQRFRKGFLGHLMS